MSQRDRVDEIQEQWAQERPDLDVTPMALIARLHRLGKRLTDELAPVFQEFGLSDGEFDLLATLRRAGDVALPAGDLASLTMVTTGAISKRLDRLEAAGLVTRRTDERDGRGRLVCLTDHGRALIDEAFTAHMANEARLVDSLSERQRTDLERLLRAWAATLDDGTAGA